MASKLVLLMTVVILVILLVNNSDSKQMQRKEVNKKTKNTEHTKREIRKPMANDYHSHQNKVMFLVV